MQKQYNLNTNCLILLADYLDNLPDDYESFNMEHFSSPLLKSKIPESVSVLGLCGTAGCAIGHAPMVEGVPKPKKNGRVEYLLG